MLVRSFTGNRAEIPVPAPPAHVHLMGICGTGMGSLAGMFHASGYRVTGSDQGAYPPMSHFLAKLGIPVMEGYRAANLEPAPDMVVVGNVIRRDNPQAVALEGSNIPFCTMPDALCGFFVRNAEQIVVTGTHGKTTVSSMIAWILEHQGRQPGFMIGGLPGNFGKNYCLGGGSFFVIEGDEYDTAYFDKTPKFVHFRPHVGVMTSCEFDHADIYDNVEQIRDRFSEFVGLIPSDGRLVAHTGDALVRGIAETNGACLDDYGIGPEHLWSAAVQEYTENGIRVALMLRGEPVARGVLPIVGRHNVLNAVAATAATACVGIEPQNAFDALVTYQGVGRRQEVKGEVAGVLVIDDFAHHPTAVKVTCDGVKKRYGDRPLIAVFEPRTNTSRRAIFQKDYVESFLGADVIVLREPRGVERIPPEERFSSRTLAQDLRNLGKEAQAFQNTEEILDCLQATLKKDDVVLVMSNGDFDGLTDRLMDTLKDAKP